jgi:hypothetical protein
MSQIVECAALVIVLAALVIVLAFALFMIRVVIYAFALAYLAIEKYKENKRAKSFAEWKERNNR